MADNPNRDEIAKWVSGVPEFQVVRTIVALYDEVEWLRAVASPAWKDLASVRDRAERAETALRDMLDLMGELEAHVWKTDMPRIAQARAALAAHEREVEQDD